MLSPVCRLACTEVIQVGRSAVPERSSCLFTLSEGAFVQTISADCCLTPSQLGAGHGLDLVLFPDGLVFAKKNREASISDVRFASSMSQCKVAAALQRMVGGRTGRRCRNGGPAAASGTASSEGLSLVAESWGPQALNSLKVSIRSSTVCGPQGWSGMRDDKMSKQGFSFHFQYPTRGARDREFVRIHRLRCFGEYHL
jgi:hypothetical protein